MAVSDSESVEQGSSRKRGDRAEDPPQTDEDMQQSDADEDEEEGEYEIEAILDSQRNAFGSNSVGYFVKWKGYSEEHNSWVAEADAGNAQELISQYWADKKNKKSGKKDTASAKGRAAGRQSTAGGGSSSTSRRKNGVANDESASAPVAKKRGRALKSVSNEDNADEIVADSEEETLVTTKKRKRGALSAARSSTPPMDDEDLQIGTMKPYMSMKSWEEMVARVDTVERKPNGELFIFFRLNTGERIMENSIICGQKFPIKLLRFYESNLRWRDLE